jgi:hypothetical protein
MTAPLARSPPPSPAAAGRGPTREPPAVRRDRCETGPLRAARAFAPALPGCGRQRARTGWPTCEPPAVRGDRGETGTLRAARALASALPGCGRLARPPLPARRPAGTPAASAVWMFTIQLALR